jgi:hypothetical protein
MMIPQVCAFCCDATSLQSLAEDTTETLGKNMTWSYTDWLVVSIPHLEDVVNLRNVCQLCLSNVSATCCRFSVTMAGDRQCWRSCHETRWGTICKDHQVVA